MADIEKEVELTEEERREIRHNNRVRAQIIAYLIITIIIVALLAGVFFAIGFMEHKGGKNDVPAVVQTAEPITDADLEEDIIEVPVFTPSPEPTPYVPSAEELAEEAAMEFVSKMTLEEKVAGLFIVNPESITGVSTAIRAGDTTKKALAANPIGGLIYYKKNIQSESQIKEMISASRDAVKYPVFIAVREEGGSVSSVANAGLANKSPSPSALADGLDAAKAFETGEYIGTYLNGLGFNLDFAPVADLAGSEVYQDRCYGSATATVTAFASNMYLGLNEAKVNGVCGHFPGMGSADADEDKGLSYIKKTKEDMYANDIEVFKVLIGSGVKMIQTTNAACESLTGEAALPCTFSSNVITGILRSELGFDGLVISDHLNQKIITDYYSSSEAAVMALKAGCDMILEPENFKEAYEGVLAAVKENVISEERINTAILRVYKIKLAE